VGRTGQNLRDLRKAMGASIYDVEQATGIHFTLISAYERGVKRPSLDNARKLAKFFGVPVAHIILSPEEVEEVLPPHLESIATKLLSRPDLLRLLAILEKLPPKSAKLLADFLSEIIPEEKPAPRE